MNIRSLSFDAKDKTVHGKFKPSTAAERQFYKQLRKVAQHSGHIVEQHTDGVKIKNDKKMQATLKAYSKTLEPWARRQSAKLLSQVQNSNKRAYNNKSKAIGKAIQIEGTTTETAALALSLMEEQVVLIQSIPIEAAQRAQKIAYEAALHGERAQPDQSVIDQLQKELGLSTEVATSRAKLIAVTETARANAAINQSRAQSVGSDQYRWHNSGDEAVRHSHKYYKGKLMQGRIFDWDKPPTLDDGMKGHPGTFPRCRCFAEPIFEDE